MRKIEASVGTKKGRVLYGVIFLTLLYFLGTIEIQSFHALLHNSIDETELHSAANESNGCHQSVYHNKRDKSCEHKSHVVALKKCPLCQLTLQSFHLADHQENHEFPICKANSNTGLDLIYSGTASLLHSSRAPPVA